MNGDVLRREFDLFVERVGFPHELDNALILALKCRDELHGLCVARELASCITLRKLDCLIFQINARVHEAFGDHASNESLKIFGLCLRLFTDLLEAQRQVGLREIPDLLLLKTLKDLLGKAEVAVCLQLQYIFADYLLEVRCLTAQICLLYTLVRLDFAVIREVSMLLLLHFDEVLYNMAGSCRQL